MEHSGSRGQELVLFIEKVDLGLPRKRGRREGYDVCVCPSFHPPPAPPQCVSLPASSPQLIFL